MKHILFLIGIVFASFTISAQSWQWAQRMGNTRSDKITSIKTDSLGFVYIAGYFSNTTTLGTNNLVLNYTANTNSKEAFIAKLDSLGYCYWARSGGEYFDDRVLGMDVDAAGNSIITGTFWQTGTGFDMGTVNVTGGAFGGGDQCFIVKHDPSGNPIYGRFVCSNSGDDQGLDVAITKSGSYYVVGFMTGTTLYVNGNTVTATNTNTGSHRHSYWVAKFLSDGTPVWAKTFGNLPWDPDAFKYVERDIAVAVDDKDGVYITGGFDGTHNFGIQSFTTNGGHDIFVMKYDTLGNFVWATQGGSNKDDWSNGICTDKIGNVYITGEHRDSLIMDTVLVKNYNKRDAFVFKIDATSGKPLWGKRAGSNLGGERGNDIVADSLCNIYVCGDINEGAKFGDDIIAPSGKMEQAFVAKLTPDGKWRWLATGGGADSNDRANAIARGRGAQIYTAGYFRAPSTYGGSSLASAGSSDGFFARLHDSSLNKGYGFKLKNPDDTILCKNDTIRLDIEDHAYFTFSPTIGAYYDAVAKQMVFTHVGTTTTYTLSGISKERCPDYDTITFTIISAPEPVAEFTVNPTSAPIVAPLFTLNNASTGATSFEWYYDGNLFSTSTNASYKFDSAGVYCFTLKATNDYGCVDTVTHCGEIYNMERVFFPNAFSPNNDGKNDEFGPLLINISQLDIKDFYFAVYNRYGELVFESDKPDVRWKGLLRSSKMADMGVYYYICKFTTPKNERIDKRGDVSLIR